MISLFDGDENTRSIQRIESLSDDSKALWGKMDVGQMLSHCQKGFRIAAGELKLKRGLIGMLFGGYGKRKYIVGDALFSKGAPTDPKLVVAGPVEFAPAQSELVALVRRFTERGPQALTSEQHPFFGEMSSQDWDRLMWKHLDHHLRQFGA